MYIYIICIHMCIYIYIHMYTHSILSILYHMIFHLSPIHQYIAYKKHFRVNIYLDVEKNMVNALTSIPGFCRDVRIL